MARPSEVTVSGDGRGMYGRKSLLFNLASKIIIRTPATGLAVATGLFLYYIVGSAALGCLVPADVWDVGDALSTLAQVVSLQDPSYLAGDKFALLFYGLVAPLSTFVWLRHCLIVHPMAIRAIGKANRQDPRQYLQDTNRELDTWWIEVCGVVAGAAACSVKMWVLDRGTEWFTRHFLLHVPVAIATFAMWYIIATFVLKGFILVAGRHFRMREDAPFYYYIRRDPFQLRYFMKDVTSVLYFILTGGFTLLAYSFLVAPDSAVIETVMVVYGVLFPIWLFRFVAIWASTERVKERRVRAYEESLIRKLGEQPPRRGVSAEEVQAQELILESMRSASLMRFAIPRSSLVALSYVVQVVLIAYKILGANTSLGEFLEALVGVTSPVK